MTFSKSNKQVNTEPGVSRKTAASIGLFGAVSIIIGSTVGVGIFFKNGNIFRNNNGNPWGVLFSWIIAFVVALAIAYSFGEIVTCKTKSANSGLAGWYERLIGYRSGRLVKILLPLLYYGIYILVDAIFFSEAIFNCFSKGKDIDCGNSTMWYIIFVALAGIFVFATLNLFCSKALQKTSNVTTILKFIPLGLVILTGIIFGCINKDQNLFINDNISTIDGKDYSGQFSFTGMLDSLPAIFFAFDSFLIIGNIAGEMKNPNKNIPLSIVVSMVVAGILYLLVTIGQICVGCGSAYAVFDFVFANNTTAKSAFHYIISIFIFISIFGVLNSMTMGAIRSFDSAVEEEIIVGSKWMKKVANGKFLMKGFILLSFVTAFYTIIFGIPSGVMNTDQIFDGVSNFIVLAFFGIYAVLSAASIFNRYNGHAPEVIKQKGQIPAAVIGSFGCFFIFGYGLIWQFCGNIVMNANKEFDTWGLFVHIEDGHKLTYAQAAIWFWTMCGIMIVVPFLNELGIKATDKNYNQAFFWQKQNRTINA